MVEIEELTQFRFYKLIPVWKQRCIKTFDDKKGHRFCNGLLWNLRVKGTLKLRCMHVDCFSVYDIPKFCSHCNREYKFEELTCVNCEPLVIETAQLYLTIDDAGKSIKKINKHYKAGKMNQEDWEAAISLNKNERDSCERKLEKLKEENPVIERLLETLIKQP